MNNVECQRYRRSRSLKVVIYDTSDSQITDVGLQLTPYLAVTTAINGVVFEMFKGLLMVTGNVAFHHEGQV